MFVLMNSRPTEKLKYPLLHNDAHLCVMSSGKMCLPASTQIHLTTGSNSCAIRTSSRPRTARGCEPESICCLFPPECHSVKNSAQRHAYAGMTMNSALTCSPDSPRLGPNQAHENPQIYDSSQSFVTFRCCFSMGFLWPLRCFSQRLRLTSSEAGVCPRYSAESARTDLPAR